MRVFVLNFYENPRLFLQLCVYKCYLTDESTICKNVSSSTNYNTTFPYDCEKYVQCKNGEFVKVDKTKTNWAYNPKIGKGVPKSGLICATSAGKLQQLSEYNLFLCEYYGSYLKCVSYLYQLALTKTMIFYLVLCTCRHRCCLCKF